MSSEEDLMEISRDLEQAWRIVTRPQEYSRYKVRKAEDLLEDTKVRILTGLNMGMTIEETNTCEDLMLGFYHYSGEILLPGFDDGINLN